MAPLTFTALTAFAVLPLARNLYVADGNVGILVISATSAIGILGIILGGWASNSHYPLLGALPGAAQLVSYEVALAFALLSGLMMAGTLRLPAIVEAQLERHTWFLFPNYGFMILPFGIYMVAAVAETNRAPFDLPEAQSEIVAGFHTEYSGMRSALYFLAEFANMFVVASLAATLFLGGWLRPFPNVNWLAVPLNVVFPVVVFGASAVLTWRMVGRLIDPAQRKILLALVVVLVFVAVWFAIPVVNQAVIGPFWFRLKISYLLYLMIWFRGTFPRYRYDQLMNIG
jgi:NADH-quinone oxidoreductase subunit H